MPSANDCWFSATLPLSSCLQPKVVHHLQHSSFKHVAPLLCSCPLVFAFTVVGYQPCLTQLMQPPGLSKFFLLYANVKDKTQRDYRAAVQTFVSWCDTNNIQSGSNEDRDWAFLEFVHDQYEQHGGACRAAVARALSGLQLLARQLKRQLPLSSQCLAGWTNLHPSVKHPPLTWSLSVANCCATRCLGAV